jgi:hypothetical protein
VTRVSVLRLAFFAQEPPLRCAYEWTILAGNWWPHDGRKLTNERDVGHRGSRAYCIIKPGIASPNWPMILNPTRDLEAHAEDQAQIRAGWGLYKHLPPYPHLATGDGCAVALDDGSELLLAELGIATAPVTMVRVVPS